MNKQKTAHTKRVLDEVNELNRLATQGKLSVPGTDYVKERQKWADEPMENILLRVKNRKEKKNNS